MSPSPLTMNTQVPSTGDNSHGAGEWLLWLQIKNEYSASSHFAGPVGQQLNNGGKIHNKIYQKIVQVQGSNINSSQFPGWRFISAKVNAITTKFTFTRASSPAAAQNAPRYYELSYNELTDQVTNVQQIIVPQSQNNPNPSVTVASVETQTSNVPRETTSAEPEPPPPPPTTSKAPPTAYASIASMVVQESPTPPSNYTQPPPTWNDNDLDLASQALPSLTGKRSNLGIGNNDFGIAVDASKKVAKARLDLQRSTLDTDVSNSNPLNRSGIYSNRPSVLLDSTYVNIDPEVTWSPESIRFDSSVLYTLTKKNFLKENLNILKDESPEDYIELEDLYKDFELKIEEVITLIDEIDELKENFIDSLDDYSEFGLNSLGYEDNKINPTKAFLQLAYEIGGYPFHTNSYFMNLVRGLEPAESRGLRSESIRSSNTYSTVSVTNEYSLNKLTSNHHLVRENLVGLSHPGYRLKGPNEGWFYESESNTDNIPYTPSEPNHSFIRAKMHENVDGIISGIQSDTGDGNVGNISGVVLANFIWSELYNSYIYYNSVPTEKSKLDKERVNKNTLYNIIGEDTLTNNLVNANNSSGIAKILRYPSSGMTIMPFEFPGLAFESADDSLANVKTGIEQWIDPNISNVFEGEKTNYTGLDSWLDELDSFINSANNKLDPFFDSGGAQIIYNEIIRSFEHVGNNNTSFPIRLDSAGIEGFVESYSDFKSDLSDNLYYDDFEAFQYDVDTLGYRDENNLDQMLYDSWTLAFGQEE